MLEQSFLKRKNLSLTLDQLEVVFQSIADSILVQDQNFKCVYANDAAAKQCGFVSTKDFLEASIEDIINNAELFGEDGQPFPSKYLTARRALRGEDFAEAVYIIKNQDKEENIVKSISRPVFAKNGRVDYAVTIFRDITAEKRKERNNRFLTDASRIFSTSLSFKETIESLGKLVVPQLADWYGVELVDEQGILQTVHASHFDKSKINLALEMRKEYPSAPDSGAGTYQVLKSGMPLLYNNFPEELYFSNAVDDRHCEMLKNLALKSVLIVPLKVKDQTIGVMNLCQSDSERIFSEEDKELGLELAQRASVAIERSRLYTSILEEQNKLKLALGAAKLGVFEWNLETQELYWSDRTIEIFGYKKDEFKGSYEEYVSRIHPEDRENSKNIVEKALLDQEDYTLEHRLLLPDGRVRWLQGNGHAFYDKNNVPTKVLGTVKDITWKKEAEFNQAKVNQLQQMAALLSNKMENHEIAKTIISQGVLPTGACESALFLLDKSSGELKEIYAEGQSLQGNDSLDQQVLDECIKTSKLTVKRRTDTKQNIFATIVASPLITEGQCIGVLKLTFSHVETISSALLDYVQALSDHAAQSIDRALAFSAAQEAKKKADFANQAKSTFLANMSHEIRTPMNAILGFSKLLSDPSNTEEERQEYLRRVEANGDYLVHLIDDILDLSRIEAGEMKMESRIFSFYELIKDVRGALEILVEDKDIQINVKMAEDVPDSIISDQVRIKQVLMNLISNSAKFTSQGSIAIKVSKDKDFLTFDVEDTGIGIPKNVQDSIFKVFSQGDSSVTRKFGGSGLGLVLSRKICEALSGELILVSTEENKGSHFRAQVGIQVNSSQSTRKENKNLSERVVTHSLKILLAEDSKDNQELIKIYLKDIAERLDIVSNGKEALEAGLRETYDIILMDVQMPEMDGLEATVELRKKGYSAPIVALTAHALPEEVKRSLNAGCNSHLIKPISRQNLITEITTLICDPVTE